ncbi:interleukin-17 receptor A isoform 2-T2 [Menidia menidia]
MSNFYMSESCSDKALVPRMDAPTGPQWDDMHEEVGIDKRGHDPVMYVVWKIKADGSISLIRGTQINIVDENTNNSICVQVSYRIAKVLRPEYTMWIFSLDFGVEPRHNYTVTVFNLPEPHIGNYRIKKQIVIPGCDDRRIQRTQLCQENGSLWTPNINVFIDEKPTFSIIVAFESSHYSEKYQVLIQNPRFNLSKSILKENSTSLNVTFELESSECEMSIMIKPFFSRCKHSCEIVKKTVDSCKKRMPFPPQYFIMQIFFGAVLVLGVLLVFLLRRTSHKDASNTSTSSAKEQSEVFHVQGRKRILIIYSLDHPLYKSIVLKLCAFLVTKCGTEVVLDLLDSTRLGVLGSVQWLDWQIESSSDKILILCSRGVQAKWRAMCGDKPVFLREDACSPVGDMLTPSLTLILPHFMRPVSFKKYIVAYFEDVCSEEDIPSPFNITVRYKLMKQFEEVFFRILDIEKHEPGRVKQIDGLSGDCFHQCPSGRALRDAIEAFHAHQMEHPQWFEDELLKYSDCEDDEVTY